MPKKILVVDDDPDIRDVVTVILESRGYEIVTACDGIECLAALRAEKPDLMVIDLLMPKMDGFAVLKELQDGRWSKFRQTPILILSSVREEASRRRYELETALEFNVDDYVEKPINPDVLLERVERLIVKRKAA
ncbi:MAG TPA: response regulator [Dehalococcoidales bacterium]|jgi:CheY-like chemotaxis protein|nr:response regulator [Dehalococcoidales bacterium]